MVVVGFSRVRAATGEQRDLAVGLQRPGGEHHADEQQRGRDHRDGDVGEPAHAARTIDVGALVQVARHALQRGRDDDEREPEVRPDAAERHRQQRGARVVEQPRVLQHGEPAAEHVGEHADLGLQQHEPHQAGHRHAGGDGAGEDGAEDADAAQVLVGQHGQADAEHEARGHGERHQLQRHAERVLELAALEHVEVPTPALHRGTCVPVTSQLEVALLDGPHQRVDRPHRDQREAGQQHRDGPRHVAQAPLHDTRSPVAASKRCRRPGSASNATGSPTSGTNALGSSRATTVRAGRRRPMSSISWPRCST